MGGRPSCRSILKSRVVVGGRGSKSRSRLVLAFVHGHQLVRHRPRQRLVDITHKHKGVRKHVHSAVAGAWRASRLGHKQKPPTPPPIFVV